MECKKCNKNIDENDVFCRFCGEKTEKNVIKPIVIDDEPIFEINEIKEVVQTKQSPVISNENIESVLEEKKVDKLENENIFEVESYKPAFPKKVEEKKEESVKQEIVRNSKIEEQPITREEVLEEKNVQINELQHDNNVQVVNHQEEINKVVEKNKDKKKRKISISTIIFGIIMLLVVAYSILVVIDVFNNDKGEDLPPVNITKTLDNLKYVVPSDFKADSENSNSIHKYNHSELDGACQLKIVTATSSYYDSVESYFNEYIENKDYINISEYSIKNINGLNWRTVSLETDINKVYYYVSNDEDNIYRVEFTVTKNEVEYCRNIHNNLLNSLMFKR